MVLHIVANVLPWSCDTSPFTFSPKKTFGCISLAARANSKKSVPRVSSNPPCLPAYEKAWQGNPPERKSTFPFKGVKSTFRTSPSIIFQFGLFFRNVLQAEVSNSFNSTWLNPARDIPNANPPAPANSSTELYALSGIVSFSFLHLLWSISLISGMEERSSM